jgi:HK97 family phage major capsid protein
MKFKTHTQVQKDLQAIADQVGAGKYEHTKNLYLEGVVVTDEGGNPLPTESLAYEVKIMPAVAGETDAAKPMAEPEKQAATEDGTAKSIRTTIRESIAMELKSWGEQSPARVTVSDPTGLRVNGRVKYLKSADSAYKFARIVLASQTNSAKAEPHKKWLVDNGVIAKGHMESVNTQGGFLVPTQFESELITLRETYGVFRQYARNRTMTSDTLRVPRRKSTLTAYAVGEASAITESQQVFEQITMVAKKFGVLTTLSNELSEDAMVNLGDDTANEIAYAFAQKEDECGFNGDGTGTLYQGIVGLKNALLNISGTLSNIKGIYDATSSGWSGVTLADFSNLMALLPAYADTANCRWYCSKNFFHGVMERLAYDAGGVTARELKDGVGEPRFMGYPVVFSQVLDRVSTAGSLPLFFGDLSMAAYFAERRGVEIATSDSALNSFEQDELAIRGLTRFDIVCPNVGDTTDAGPIVALYTT